MLEAPRPKTTFGRDLVVFMSAPAPAVPPIKMRPSTAPAAGKGERPLITPRNKKASRSLFRELQGTCDTMAHSKKRAINMHTIVVGALAELEAAVLSTERTLANNRRMVGMTKDTGGDKKPSSPNGAVNRRLTPGELEEIRREKRDELEANGEERDPTEEEVQEEVERRIAKKKEQMEVGMRRVGSCNKGIVGALEKLREQAKRSIEELLQHEKIISAQIRELELVKELLELHKQKRDDLFDEQLSTDLPYAKKMGVRTIKRSILYQKMNLMPKDREGKPLNVDWNDKDELASEGKKDILVDGMPHFKDDKGRYGLTAHETTFAAAREEDQSRFVCNTALKAVRDAQSQLALCKSQLQVAVLHSREQVMRSKRAAKTGNFGSSEERNTDPATRKCAANPEDSGS